MAVAPADLTAFQDRAVQPDASPSVTLARPNVLDGLTTLRYSLALSSPADAKLRHIPYTALSYEQQESEVATRLSASIPDVESDLGPLWEL